MEIHLNLDITEGHYRYWRHTKEDAFEQHNRLFIDIERRRLFGSIGGLAKNRIYEVTVQAKA